MPLVLVLIWEARETGPVGQVLGRRIDRMFRFTLRLGGFRRPIEPDRIALSFGTLKA